MNFLKVLTQLYTEDSKLHLKICFLVTNLYAHRILHSIVLNEMKYYKDMRCLELYKYPKITLK